MIIGGAALIALVLIAGIVIAIVYETPSCSDGKQNQDEVGIDCGGSCAYLCESQVQTVRTPLVRAISSPLGRTDVVAYVENRNQEAEAKNASYVVEVFGEGGALLGMRTGMIDLPARSVVPLFIPGIVLGIASSPQVFITFDGISWRIARGEEEPLRIGRATIVEGASPRVSALVENMVAEPTYDRTIIATVFGANDTVIGASQTVLKSIPALGSAEAVFTWTSPFPEPIVRVEVRAQPRLP